MSISKQCSKCEEIKPLKDFLSRDSEPHRTGKHSSWCRTCKNTAAKNYYRSLSPEGKKRRTEQHREAKKRYRKSAKGKIAQQKYQEKYYKEHSAKLVFKNRLRKYGLTEPEFQSLLISCNNKCLICLKETDDLAIDHDHETGKVRGLLCDACNQGLGFFKDNIDLMKSAISYLEQMEEDL